MRERQVVCPVCGVHLVLPPDYAGFAARCGRCRMRFNLPKISVTDEAVSLWLHEEDESDDDAGDAPVAPGKPSKTTSQPTDVPPHSGQTAVLPAMSEEFSRGLRLVRTDAHGAMFEFSASRLNETAFRAAMPRRCLQCGARAHLGVHVIIFTGQLRDSVSLEAEHAINIASVFTEDELRQMVGEEIVRRLPPVPSMSPPADQPMIYWVCDMCSGTNVISGQIETAGDSRLGVCRLQIHNLRRAGEFFAAAGGAGTREYHDLMRRVAALVDSPWESLPEVVQHRVEQWFRPGDAEQFLVYVPDRDRVRTEDGMSGIVVSTKRFIYHSPVRHREAQIADSLELELATAAGKSSLQVRTAGWELRRVTVDREGLERLRRGLVTSRFRAVWR